MEGNTKFLKYINKPVQSLHNFTNFLKSLTLIYSDSKEQNFIKLKKKIDLFIS